MGCDHTGVSACLDNMLAGKVLLEAEKALEAAGA
jgi:hypothetical protein